MQHKEKSEKSERRSIRLTDTEWTAYISMGGTQWLRAMLQPTVKRLTVDVKPQSA